MPNYTFKFKPIDTFFFGTEKHVIGENNEPVTNYFVESFDYPQQTTLLGAIRYYLLKHSDESIFKNNRIIDKDEASKLIGPKSFISIETDQEFGIIEKISALYWLDNEGNKFALSSLAPEVSISNGQVLFEGEEYNAKKSKNFLKCHLFTSNKAIAPIGLDKIIESEIIIGNRIPEDGQDNIEGFYKQNQKKIKKESKDKEWAFAVDVTLKKDIDLADKQEFATLGGERSLFNLHIFETLEFFEPQAIPNQIDSSYIFFSSDTFIEYDVLKIADFGITEFVGFRNLISTVNETTDYRGLSKSDKKQIIRNEKRFNLLKRGSLLFFKDNNKLDEVVKRINSMENAKKIGFNQIKSIKKI
jgi:CRISPR-associated protein Cmr3